jgi:hypothetical protein
MSSNIVKVTLSVDEFNELNLEASRNGFTLEEYLHDLSVGKRLRALALQPDGKPAYAVAPPIELETQDVGSNLERRRGRGRGSQAAE